MATYNPTPRINSALLQKNTGGTVRLVGNIVGINQNYAIIETSDKGQVKIILATNSMLRQGTVEVLGKVTEDLSVQELTSHAFAGTYDAEAYDKMVKLAH
eukprot:jgi/Hompol1/2530/HPOL_006036-RA